MGFNSGFKGLMYKKFVYEVGNNKKVILWCTDNQISRLKCSVKYYVYSNTSFLLGWQPLVGHGILIIQSSRSHSNKSHSAGPLWTSNQPFAQTCTWQHTTLTRGRPPCPRGGFKLAFSICEQPQTHALVRRPLRSEHSTP